MKVTISDSVITIDFMIEETLMASISQLVSQQVSQTATMQEIATDVQGLLAAQVALIAQVAALQAQIAAGGGISAADLDAVLATMQAQQAQLDAIAAAVPPVAP